MNDTRTASSAIDTVEAEAISWRPLLGVMEGDLLMLDTLLEGVGTLDATRGVAPEELTVTGVVEEETTTDGEEPDETTTGEPTLEDTTVTTVVAAEGDTTGVERGEAAVKGQLLEVKPPAGFDTQVPEGMVPPWQLTWQSASVH